MKEKSIDNDLYLDSSSFCHLFPIGFRINRTCTGTFRSLFLSSNPMEKKIEQRKINEDYDLIRQHEKQQHKSFLSTFELDHLEKLIQKNVSGLSPGF